jgi:ribonuclease III
MFSDLMKRLGYQFSNIKLLEEALTHPSVSEERNYERLEFLGDSILSFVITTMLLEKFTTESEGDLAKRRSSVINGKILCSIANSLEINQELIISESEEKTDGRNNPRNLENTIEAIIGAIYIDSGIESCKDFIISHWTVSIDANVSPPVDDKTFLQEWSQDKGHGLPQYSLLEKTGPDHKPLFLVEVKVGDLPKISASASSKKDAEKNAAQKMIEYIKENDSKS